MDWVVYGSILALFAWACWLLGKPHLSDKDIAQMEGELASREAVERLEDALYARVLATDPDLRDRCFAKWQLDAAKRSAFRRRLTEEATHRQGQF